MNFSTSASTLKKGGKRRTTNRRRHRITRNKNVLYQTNIKVQRFKNIKDRPIPQKGITYSIEKPDVISRDNTIEGDIIKKYVDGKLVDQKFVTKNKILEIAQNYKKMVKGGVANLNTQHPQIVYVQQPQQQHVIIQDNTTVAQNVKSGFGLGLGLGAAEIVLGLFGRDN
jgi:hypothetical protein